MKKSFKFDPKTGTMVTSGREQKVTAPVSDTVAAPNGNETSIPSFRGGSQILPKQAVPAPHDCSVVKMKRVGFQTAVQLVDSNGVPESYLDPDNTGVIMFRERQDYSLYQIVDERSSKPLAYIGGYALQIGFNMAELNTMDRIEQCLEGLKKLFRHHIMNQPINTKSE